MDALQHRIENLNKREREEFEAAKCRGYLVDRSKTRGHLYDAYAIWCAVTKTPAISIRRGHVEFWFLSGSGHMSNQGMEEMIALWRKYSFLSRVVDPSNYICGNTGYFIGIIREDREPLARDLFLVLRKHGMMDTSMRDLCPPLPLNHSVSAWIKDQAIPRGWPQLSSS